METFADIPVRLFTNPANWEAWLADHFAEQTGLWLKIAKKDSGKQSVTYSQALEVALCYGWIDGQLRSIDNEFYMQKFTPRRPRSVWSKINVEKVERLTKEGKMRPSGLAAVEAAKGDGRWTQAYAPSSTMAVPEDFEAALNKHPKAKAFFETLNKTNRYSFLWRIETARRPETRKARIQKFVVMLERGEAFH